MNLEQQIHEWTMVDLLSGALDELALLDNPDVPEQMKEAARWRQRVLLTRAGMLATAIEIERAPQCR